MIQVQRGAGNGVIGYPAVGGSINIITSTYSNQKKFELYSTLGSYNYRKYGVSVSSGLIDNKYSFSARLSRTLSSGYRDNSWVELNSYYLSAVRFDKNITTQFNMYGGPLEDGLVYNGLPKWAIKNKDLRKENYSYWEDQDGKYTYTVRRKPTEIENLIFLKT
jgi:iron complex outermembrane receptor protein